MPFNNQVPTSLCTLRPPLGVQGFGESLSSRAQGAKARFHCLGGGAQLGLEGKAHPPSPAEHTHTHIHTYTYTPTPTPLPCANRPMEFLFERGARFEVGRRQAASPTKVH